MLFFGEYRLLYPKMVAVNFVKQKPILLTLCKLVTFSVLKRPNFNFVVHWMLTAS